MKPTVSTTIFALFFALVFWGFSKPAADEREVFLVQPDKSKITWTGKNVAGGAHSGEIALSKGQLIYNNGRFAGGDFTADINSIKVTDLTGDRAERLAGHLKNEDFFDSPSFPEAKLKITKVEGSASNPIISGDLTIKGITKPISFQATVQKTKDQVRATAKGVKIDRTAFDIKYRSGNFFSGLGDRAIADEFQLDIGLVAAK